MELKKNVPGVRFRGVSGAWEESVLENVVEFYTGLTYSPKDVLDEGGTFVLRSSNVKNGEIVNADNVFVNSNVVNSDNVKIGDIIVVVRNGSRSLIGKHAQVKKTMNNTVIGAFMTGIRSEQSAFINALLDTTQFNKEIEKNLGATINQITTGSFKKMNFWIPEFQEQSRIGTWFQHFDQLITLHQKKYNKLTNIKKAMLEKMFPKNGADVPEIRFEGFEGKWEERSLGEVADLLTGYPFESKGFSNDGVFLVRGINVKRGYIDMSKDVSEYWPSSYGLEGYLLKENDILIQMDGALIGKSYAKIESENLPAMLVQRVTRIRRREVNCGFIYPYLQRDFLFYIKANKTETAVPHLSLNDIRGFQITVPSDEEQQKIGTYFQKLDHLITLQQTQIEKLKNIKKACLEKMFV